MTLVVENGTGLANAESYISVADATTFHEAQGELGWGELYLEVMEQSLRRATAYMVGVYRLRWLGYPTSDTQALDWPRQQVCPRGAIPGSVLSNDTIPVSVKNACASLAWRAANADLLADYGRLTASESIGPISVSYAPGSSPVQKYPAVDNMLRSYLRSVAGQIPLVRM